jgi:hypothetical protein
VPRSIRIKYAGPSTTSWRGDDRTSRFHGNGFHLSRIDAYLPNTELKRPNIRRQQITGSRNLKPRVNDCRSQSGGNCFLAAQASKLFLRAGERRLCQHNRVTRIVC